LLGYVDVESSEGSKEMLLYPTVGPEMEEGSMDVGDSGIKNVRCLGGSSGAAEALSV
jgi:hypothetical protein